MLRKITILLCLLLAAAALSGCQSQDTAAPQEQLNYIAVETQTVIQGTVEDRTVLTGRAMPSKDVMIFPQVPGTVERVYVDQGQRVSKGDRLFSMDRSSISQQLTQAEAAYNSANANYQMTRDQIDSAKASLERMTTLYAEGAISKAQYEQAELAASEKPLEAAQAGLQQAAAAYASARDAYNDTLVSAPISGLVTSLAVEAGEMASNAQPALIIVDIDALVVDLNITEKLINSIHTGDEVDVEIPAVDVRTSGTVISVSPMIDSRTLLYPVEVAIDNPEGLIKASMFAEVSLVTDLSEAVLIVPSDAVVVKDGQSVIYTVADGRAVLNAVETGLDNGSETAVLSGLEAGMEIITAGQHYVTDGSTVKVIQGK